MLFFLPAVFFLLFCLSPLSVSSVSSASPLSFLRSPDAARFAPSSPFSALDECNGDDYGTAGNFSFYVFEMSWSASFCYSSSHSGFPLCQNPTPWMAAYNLTIHGLWPNYNAVQGGSHYWPQCCPSTYGANLSDSDMNSVLPLLQLAWPSEQQPGPVNGDWSNTFWEHEWGKHGTCDGRSPQAYFTSAVDVMLSPHMATPSFLSSNAGGTFALSDLQKYYNKGSPCQVGQPCLMGAQCSGGSGNEYLEGVTICLDRSFNPVVCPAKVIVGKTDCQGPTINLDAFGQQRKHTQTHLKPHEIKLQ